MLIQGVSSPPLRCPNSCPLLRWPIESATKEMKVTHKVS